MSQGELRCIERSTQIEVVHCHEKAQPGMTGERASQARVVASRGRESTDAAARQVEDSVVVPVEIELPAQVGFIRGLEASRQPARIVVDRDWRSEGATAAAPAARWRGQEAAHPRI